MSSAAASPAAVADRFRDEDDGTNVRATDGGTSRRDVADGVM